jgi:hypothetical protein
MLVGLQIGSRGSLVFQIVKFLTLQCGGIPYVGGPLGPVKVKEALYIKLQVGHTPKGEVEKNYLVCYPIFEKKETSCKEIV